MAETVVILGAGATKSCKGPLTNEILRDAFLSRADFPDPKLLKDLGRFLDQNFHVSAGAAAQDYPGLPLLMSLIDTAIERRQTFLRNWDLQAITRLRHAIELAIFHLLEYRLEKAPTNNHYGLFTRLYPKPDEPRIISMNYDVIADAAVMFYGESRGDPVSAGGAWRFPDYGCDISTDAYRGNPGRFGTLLKLHGSLNWLYCGTCHRLELGASESRLYVSALNSLVGAGHGLENFYIRKGLRCTSCKTGLKPLLVAPSHLKNYRNPHLANVWYRAETLLRSAGRAIFIGYSLPEDDVEVIYLLKRGLAHLQPSQISVVGFDEKNPDVALHDHAVGRRYRSLFGDTVRWSARGLDGWLATDPLEGPGRSAASRASETVRPSSARRRHVRKRNAVPPRKRRLSR